MQKLNSIMKISSFSLIKLKCLQKFQREKKTAAKENLVKRSVPPKLHEVPLSTLAEQQQRRKVARSCHTARGPRVLLGKWHGRASWHGAPVPNLCWLAWFASRGMVCSYCLAPPALRGTPSWVGFSLKFKYKFWASFWAYLHIAYKTLNKANQSKLTLLWS